MWAVAEHRRGFRPAHCNWGPEISARLPSSWNKQTNTYTSVSYFSNKIQWVKMHGATVKKKDTHTRVLSLHTCSSSSNSVINNGTYRVMHNGAYRVIQEERSIFWEVTLSVIVSKNFIWTGVWSWMVTEMEPYFSLFPTWYTVFPSTYSICYPLSSTCFRPHRSIIRRSKLYMQPMVFSPSADIFVVRPLRKDMVQ